MGTKTQYFDIFAWLGRKKVKIGTAYYQNKDASIRLRADPHVDASKIGRALLKGDILIEKQTTRRAVIAAPDDYSTAVTDDYTCAADEDDEAREARELIALRTAQNREVR